MAYRGSQVLLVATVVLAASVLVGSTVQDGVTTWSAKYYDPASENDIPADLILPMPCGGAMAFQRVTVPAGTADHFGEAESESGFAKYLRLSQLGGPFSGNEGNSTHFFIGRYEVTAAQATAIRGDCKIPSMSSRVPAVELSWFDATLLARDYTEWLRRNTLSVMPRENGVPGFVRLPTEVEWEYATRGGMAVDPTEFSAYRFPYAGAINALAWHQGNARGTVHPIGLRAPNPLGLFDVYGNAAEWMLDWYRVNEDGRGLGQAGGVTTRGGSFLSAPEHLDSAKRSEWPVYSVTDQQATALATFGTRFVIATHVSTTAERVERLRMMMADTEETIVLPSELAEVMAREDSLLDESNARSTSDVRSKSNQTPDRRPGYWAIVEAQILLTTLGYTPGPIDGKLGPRTVGAVQAFEADMGLGPEGRVDDKMLRLLRHRVDVIERSVTSSEEVESSVTQILVEMLQIEVKQQALRKQIEAFSGQSPANEWMEDGPDVLESQRALGRNRPSHFTRGSHQDVLLLIQGKPDKVRIHVRSGYEVWNFDRSRVTVSTKTRRVLRWRNEGNLRVVLRPGSNRTKMAGIQRGSHQDDVLRLHGTPGSIIDYPLLERESWHFGGSFVMISVSTRRVVFWHNAGNLRIGIHSEGDG